MQENEHGGVKVQMNAIHDTIDPIIREMLEVYPDCKAVPVIELEKLRDGRLAVKLKSLTFTIG